MKNSYPNIFTFNKKILEKVIISLNKSGVAGLPTETVYGLGGNAYSKKSVKKIFKLKGRSKSNPLIIHYYNLDNAIKDISINKNLIKKGIYNLSGPKISKLELLNIIKKIYDKKILIIPDNKLKIDRSLNSDKFIKISK